MAFKGIKWWVAFCEAMIFLVLLPLIFICFAGLFPCLLVINKRDAGEFGVKRIFRAMVLVISDIKDTFIDAINDMDEIYED